MLLEKPKIEKVSTLPEIIQSESDPGLNLESKKHEKSEIVKRRPRVLLAAPPMLEEIPEEKSHGSGSDSNVARTVDNQSSKARKGRKHANIFQVFLINSGVSAPGLR